MPLLKSCWHIRITVSSSCCFPFSSSSFLSKTKDFPHVSCLAQKLLDRHFSCYRGAKTFRRVYSSSIEIIWISNILSSTTLEPIWELFPPNLFILIHIWQALTITSSTWFHFQWTTANCEPTLANIIFHACMHTKRMASRPIHLQNHSLPSIQRPCLVQPKKKLQDFSSH
jgi:hypothetical protein